MPKISVIVPVYKVEAFIDKCIISILNQTYQDMEIILVDDGSPDQCGAICDKYAAEDPRVKVIHKENGGLSSARNAGIEAACGTYIGFVDSDDYIEPEMYEKLLAALEENDADISLCNYDYVDLQGTPDEKMRKLSPIVTGVLDRRDALLKLDVIDPSYSFYVTAWNKLYKRSLFDELRFPMGKLHEDEFTAHYLFAKCRRIATVSDVLYQYVQRSGSIMNCSVSVKSLDAVYALYDRYEFYKKEGMAAAAASQLRVAQWKFSALQARLPSGARKEVCAAAMLLLPDLLKSQFISALRLCKAWLKYLLRANRTDK